MKQKKLIFNFFVNRNCKKLIDSRKRAQILADNRKSHHPIETLVWGKTYRFCNLRIWKYFNLKKRLTLLKMCVTSFLYVVRWSIYDHFMGFRVTGFLCTFFFSPKSGHSYFSWRRLSPLPSTMIKLLTFDNVFLPLRHSSKTP